MGLSFYDRPRIFEKGVNMGRYTGPVCRLCRREGMKLFLKGARCNMAKCPIEVGRAAPGMHGAKRSKPSDYAKQFREKQRLRRIYGLHEGQLRIYFERAAKSRGVTGEVLLQLLEMRLDNLVYRMGFQSSRNSARQFVLHRHIKVNGKIANIPSMILKPGDVVAVKESKRAQDAVKRCAEASDKSPENPWLTVDSENMKGEILHVPSREEISPIINEQLVVELLSK